MGLGDCWLLLHGDGLHPCSDQVRHTHTHTESKFKKEAGQPLPLACGCDPQVTINDRSRREPHDGRHLPLDGSWAAAAAAAVLLTLNNIAHPRPGKTEHSSLFPGFAPPQRPNCLHVF